MQEGLSKINKNENREKLSYFNKQIYELILAGKRNDKVSTKLIIFT